METCLRDTYESSRSQTGGRTMRVFFQFCFLWRWKSHKRNHFKVRHSAAPSVSTTLGNSRLCLAPEHFYRPRRRPPIHRTVGPPSRPPRPWQPRICLLWTFHRNWIKEHTAFGDWIVTEHDASRFLHVGACVYLCLVPFSGCADSLGEQHELQGRGGVDWSVPQLLPSV